MVEGVHFESNDLTSESQVVLQVVLKLIIKRS